MADELLEPSTYSDYQFALQPPHLSGPWGEKWARSFGLLKDGLSRSFVYAVKARFVSVCPEDGLAYIGWERDLERGPSESASSYRIRLKNAWVDYEWMGTDKGIADNLAVLGITATIVRDRGKSWIRDTSLPYLGSYVSLGATAFTHDSNDPGDVWGRMWIIITDPPWSRIESYTDLAALYPTWGDWSAAGIGWGLTASLDEIGRIRRIAKKWTGSHALVVNIIVISRGRVFGFPLVADYSSLPSDTFDSYVAYWEGF